MCIRDRIWTEDFGLFCFDVAHGEGRVIDNLEEISSEEWFKAVSYTHLMFRPCWHCIVQIAWVLLKTISIAKTVKKQ